MKWTELTSKTEIKKIYDFKNIQNKYNHLIYTKNIDI